ncbi:MAG: hypothetical protein DRJ38_04040 [Thermoprotei archaeon]|nr:MAG: hypothetical protein DRJ38_04040 [Thermoprotei archaeon]
MKERIIYPSDLAAYCVISLLAIIVAMLSDIFYPDPELSKRVLLYTVMILSGVSFGWVLSQGEMYE